MILYGIKLWTSNKYWFQKAVLLYNAHKINFIELYHDATKPFNTEDIALLRPLPITIHNTSDLGFHEFIIEKKQMNIWEKTISLANFCDSQYIIVHPGQKHSLKTFLQNLRKIDDPRIIIENMAGLDTHGTPMFGQYIDELKKINQYKPICFDLEKGIKAACYQNINYKKYVTKCVADLSPFYFHLSGGDIHSPIDEHTHLWGTNMDITWIKNLLTGITSAKQKIYIVFETPKNKKSLSWDIQNIEYFKHL